VIIVSSATLLAWKINGRVPGMRPFAFGLVAIALGSVLGISRLLVGGKGIIIACNVLMLGGMVVVISGIREFRGFPPLQRYALLSFGGTVSAFFLYWLLVHENFGMRVAVMSVGFTLLSLDAAGSMFRQVRRRDRTIYWPVGFAFVFTAFYMAVRSVSALSGSYGSGMLSPVPVEIASTICADIAYVGCAFGMLLASNTQLRLRAEQMALFDPLTNLPNRRMLLERLLCAEQNAIATGRQFGVIYLDLDGFKLVNDTLGHAAGDELLRKVSAEMSRMLRPGDCLARIGGDEFVVLMETLEGRGEVAALAARLKAAVESKALPGDAERPARISCGVALFPEDGHSAHDVMRKADVAMYRAKRQRRKASQPAAV
jgi:diguanylate cyclase (GGDEF)-like protein